jgi:hypothetical protein
MVRSSCRVADSSLQVMAFRVAQANRVWGYSLSSNSMVYRVMCSSSMGVGWGSGYVAGLFAIRE